MSPQRPCPDCAAPLPADAPRGMCPNCLLRAALARSAGGSAGRAELTASLGPAGAGAPAAGALAALAETVGGVPRVLLRDTDGPSAPEPLIQPASPEIPGPAGRSAHLQLFGEIARGGMGAVLKGRDVDLGRDLAVKVLLERHRDDPDLVRRFIEEAQIAGQLQHPGVVPVYELGAFADLRPYFAMKLVKGRTLAAVLAGRPDPAEGRMGLLATMLQVGQTMAYAHARGVIHRDLKPSNVMVGSFGEVQVMDWGLAKVLARGGVADDEPAGRDGAGETVIATARSGGSDSDLSRAGSVLGTPAYMAPEQARGEVEAVDERADVFALGSILCEVLTGQPAFTGRSSAEIQRRAARGDLADALARLEVCGAEAELVALARDCLAPERDDRPRDASEFADRLGGYLASIERRLRDAELERAAEAARAEEARARAAVERSRRRRTAALAASLLALATLGGLSFTYLLQQRQARLAAADRVLGDASTLLSQARARPEDPLRWQTALAALNQIDAAGFPEPALARLEGLSDEIRSGAAIAQADRDLLAALADIRTTEADALDGAALDAGYAEAFRRADLDLDALPPDEAATRLRGRPATVRVEMAAFLDHWAGIRRGIGRPADSWRRLLDVARAADPDPYRDRLRQSLKGGDLRPDRSALRNLAADRRSADLPAPTLVLLASTLGQTGDVESGVVLLEQAAMRQPGDAWINFTLAEWLEQLWQPRHEDALRYYAAARALRPEMGHNLAHLLVRLNRESEAERVFAHLVDRRPDDPRHRTCYSLLLVRHRKYDEAIATQREAVREMPGDAGARAVLGLALEAGGHAEEAIDAWRESLRLNSAQPEVWFWLGRRLAREHRTDEFEEVAAAYRKQIRLDPAHLKSYLNLGEPMTRWGKPSESMAAAREAIRQRPDDARAHARLAFALDANGRSRECAQALRESLRLDPEQPLLWFWLGKRLLVDVRFQDLEAVAQDYRRALLRDAEKPEADARTTAPSPAADGADAAEYYARVLALLPKSNLGDIWSSRSRLCNELTANPQVFDRLLDLRPDDPLLWFARGLARAREGRWGDAASDFARGDSHFREDASEFVFCQGCVRLLAGDDAGYRKLVARMVEADGRAETPVSRFVLARIGGVGADGVADPAQLLHWAEEAVADEKTPWGLHALGLAQFRAGRFREAIRSLEESEESWQRMGSLVLDSAVNWPVLAMAHDRLGEPDRAAYWLGRVTRLLDAVSPAVFAPDRGSMRMTDWLEVQVLRREAERALGDLSRAVTPLSAILSGKAVPVDSAEGIMLANLCAARRLNAASARLWERVLGEEDAPATDRRALHLYDAARVAALAGCGQGKDTPPPDASTRAALRRRSLAWLRAGLALWAERLELGPGEARIALSHWTVDPDFAGVRDPAALAKLPPDEQVAWRELWREAEALRQRAAAHGSGGPPGEPPADPSAQP